MGFFDFLSRKPEPLLAVFGPAMSADEALAVVPEFTKSLMHAVHRFAVQFYRDIHSHHSDGFPAVKEEIFFLLFSATERHIRSSRSQDQAERILGELKSRASGALLESDRSISPERFWAVYEERIVAYSAQQGSTPARGAMVAVFNAQLIARLHDWVKLVSFHGAALGAEALEFLEGEG